MSEDARNPPRVGHEGREGSARKLAQRLKDPRAAMAAMIVPAAVYATAVANNVIVAAKKVAFKRRCS